MHKLRRTLTAVAATAALGLAGCATPEDDPILISGSATVNPITAMAARETGAHVEQEAEGTLDGFDRFCAGETHLNNASAAIPGPGQPEDLMQVCADNGVEYIELPIALDALSVVRHIDNDFATDLSLEELQLIWEPDSEVSTWSDVREEWPEEEIVLVGRPEGSGTFNYFTHFVSGGTGEIREDQRTTDGLDELASWVAEEPNALGYMGAGNYLSANERHRNLMTTVAVDGVEPTLVNAQSGEYDPLTRPLFLYVSTRALDDREDVRRFVEEYLEIVPDVLPRAYFYRLPEEAYDAVRERLDDRVTGSLLKGDPYADVDIAQLLVED